MLFEYSKLIVLFVLALVISFLVFGVSYLLVLRNYDHNKISTYECGFIPFGDVRSKFEVKFYLVGLLFIIFDLEILYLFPWIVVFNRSMCLFGVISMFFFLIVLLVGFLYEWSKGALDW